MIIKSFPKKSAIAVIVVGAVLAVSVSANAAPVFKSDPSVLPGPIMIADEANNRIVSTAKADGAEIVEIKWFTRESMKAAVNSGEISLPPSISVSRRMIEYWYGAAALVDLMAPQ